MDWFLTANYANFYEFWPDSGAFTPKIGVETLRTQRFSKFHLTEF